MRKEDSPLSSPTSLGALSDDLEHVVEEITELTTWHVRCGPGHESIVGLDTQEEAIEVACRLLDGGVDVVGLGPGPGSDILSQEQSALVYARWVGARHH
jgi:hypothetical protein